jgi:hypothetical protein
MQEIIRILAENPLAAIAVSLVALVILFFLFKSLLKLALIVIIIVVAIFGFYYFQHPKDKPVTVKETIEKAKTETSRVAETGKKAVEAGRKLADKAKVVLEKGKAMVDKGKAMFGPKVDGEEEVADQEKSTTSETGKKSGARASDKK